MKKIYILKASDILHMEIAVATIRKTFSRCSLRAVEKVAKPGRCSCDGGTCPFFDKTHLTWCILEHIGKGKPFVAVRSAKPHAGLIRELINILDADCVVVPVKGGKWSDTLAKVAERWFKKEVVRL